MKHQRLLPTGASTACRHAVARVARPFPSDSPGAESARVVAGPFLCSMLKVVIVCRLHMCCTELGASARAAMRPG